MNSINLTNSTNVTKPGSIISVYLNTSEFMNSLVNIPTIISSSSSLSDSLYIYGRSTIYRNKTDNKFGICSASFMCSKNKTDVYSDITNYLSLSNGLIVSWFTPARPVNLEVDSIIHSMVTECIVVSDTKIGVNPFYGKKYNLTVRSVINKEENIDRIYFDFVPYKINFSV